MVGPEFLRPGDDRDVLVSGPLEIEKVHLFQIKPLYMALHHDLRDNGWVDPVSGDDLFEGLYWERILGNGMKEHHMWWRVVQIPAHGSDYVRYALKIDFQTLAVNKSEIAYKGKKKKVESADLIIRIWSWVQWDYKNLFKDSIVKGLQQTFRRQIYKDELQKHWDHLYDETIKLSAFIKNYLDIEEISEQPRQFHPESGYKDQF